MKSRNESFKHIPAPLARQPCSWEESTDKVLFAQCSFIDQKSSRVCFSGSSACPKKAAWIKQFVLGDVAVGEGGMWLQEGEQVPLQLWGAAWACCLVRSVPMHRPGCAVQAAIMQGALKW